jgi:hypothetical protein
LTLLIFADGLPPDFCASRSCLTLDEEKKMTRGIVLFTALFFTALVAGGAFVIWIDYNPTGMSATFYVEKMQHAIRVFTAPLPTIVILSDPRLKARDSGSTEVD